MYILFVRQDHLMTLHFRQSLLRSKDGFRLYNFTLSKSWDYFRLFYVLPRQILEARALVFNTLKKISSINSGNISYNLCITLRRTMSVRLLPIWSLRSRLPLNRQLFLVYFIPPKKNIYTIFLIFCRKKLCGIMWCILPWFLPLWNKALWRLGAKLLVLNNWVSFHVICVMKFPLKKGDFFAKFICNKQI